MRRGPPSSDFSQALSSMSCRGKRTNSGFRPAIGHSLTLPQEKFGTVEEMTRVAQGEKVEYKFLEKHGHGVKWEELGANKNRCLDRGAFSDGMGKLHWQGNGRDVNGHPTGPNPGGLDKSSGPPGSGSLCRPQWCGERPYSPLLSRRERARRDLHPQGREIGKEVCLEQKRFRHGLVVALRQIIAVRRM